MENRHSDVDSDAELIDRTLSEGGVSESQGWDKRTLLNTVLCPCLRRSSHQYTLQHSSTAPPKDRYNLVYLAMVMAGAGFLFPWSSYITAVDYFAFLYKEEFREVSEAIPMTYLLTTLLFSTITISLVNLLPIHGRIGFGYVMFTGSLLFVPLLDIGINNCTISTHVSYYLTVMSVVAVGVGSGVQQSSYYGLSSQLPRRYSQAVMAGESVAGLVVSINRIITKLVIKSDRVSAITFFALCLVFIVVCVGCHCFIRMSPFVKYHMTRCQKKEVEGEAPLREMTAVEEHNGLVQEQGVSESDQETLVPTPVDLTRTRRCLNGLKTRILVSRQIWQLIVAIFANYFVTLLLFPGLISEVQYCAIGDWMPIILIASFNLTDFVAKWLALCPVKWSPTGLMAASLLRFVFIPLVLLCVVPSPTFPVVGSGVIGWSILFTFFLGLTNGYFGSLPMINVSLVVQKQELRELAGTILVTMLLFALALGSVLAYALVPLTKLAEYHSCNLTEHHFDLCNYGNTSLT